MRKEQLIPEIQALQRKGNLEKALELLAGYLEGNEDGLDEVIIMLQATLSGYMEDYMGMGVTDEAHTAKLNGLNRRIAMVVKQLPDEGKGPLDWDENLKTIHQKLAELVYGREEYTELAIDQFG